MQVRTIHSSTQPLLKTTTTQPQSELERHQLTFSRYEKIKAIVVAALLSLGDTTGGILAFWQFGVTPESQFGAGIALSQTAHWVAFGAVGLFTALITIPLTYYMQRKFTLEAKGLEIEIKKEEQQRKRYREELFLELLRLRCLLTDNNQFENAIANLDLESKEAHADKLITLVNQIYYSDYFRNQYQHLDPRTLKLSEAKHAKPDTQHTFQEIIHDSHLITNNEIRQQAISSLARHYRNFEQQLNRCFKPVNKLPTFYKPSIKEGAAYMVGVSGALFGSYAATAGTLVGVGLCAALPGVGWSLIALACLIGGIAIGIWAARAKFVNKQRKVLAERITDRNQTLADTRQQIQNEITRSYLRNPNQHLDRIHADNLEKQISHAVEKKAEIKLHAVEQQAKDHHRQYEIQLTKINRDNKKLEIKNKILKKQCHELKAKITSQARLFHPARTRPSTQIITQTQRCSF